MALFWFSYLKINIILSYYFSDLRLRINEKRIDSHVRPEEKDHLSRSRRYDVERERPSRSHHSSPPREKRRAGKKLLMLILECP